MISLSWPTCRLGLVPPGSGLVRALLTPATVIVPSGGDLVLALIASLVAVGVIVVGLIWMARRRSRDTVEGKIKSYRKNSVELMDRLDALKERLKLLPTEDTDFKSPMSGETLAFYEETQRNVARLWD